MFIKFHYGLKLQARFSRTSAAGKDLGKEKKREALVCRAWAGSWVEV